MGSVLETILKEKVYDIEKVTSLTQDISDKVKDEIKALQVQDGHSERYKIMVQVYIGEKRGQGVRIGNRCFWDQATDFSAAQSFVNVLTTCVAGDQYG